MTLPQAIQILKAHNNWRRGKIEDNPNTPKEIGEALEVVIAWVEKMMKK